MYHIESYRKWSWEDQLRCSAGNCTW